MKITPEIEDNKPFCDKVSIAKIRRRLTEPTLRTCKKVAFLILSGSFNPVHTQHVRLLEATRRHLENLGWGLVAGFLAPSSEIYVEEKLGKSAWSVDQRISLCNLAIRGSDWMSVCSKGELSSNWVRRSVKDEIEHHCFDLLGGRKLTGVEIMDSDTVIRIFNKIIAQDKYKSGESTQRGRVICYFLRPGLNNSKQREQIEEIAPDVTDMGVKLVHIDPNLVDIPLESTSSTAIRELISKGDWETLRSKKWLSPAVLKEIKLQEL